MSIPVKLLIVEDSEDDTQLALRALRNGGYDPTSRRVQTATALESALAREHWDAVISDFMMPGFTGMDALRIFRASGLDIPFILVSGTIGEDIAVNAMKAGASDYVMKQNLLRLAPALQREQHETETRADLRLAQLALADSERQFRQMAENIQEAFTLFDVIDNRFLYISPAYDQIWGHSRDRLYADQGSWVETVHPDDRETTYENYRKGVAAGRIAFEYRIVHPDGSIHWVETKSFPVHDDAGNVVRIASIGEDITERKGAEARIVYLNRIYAMLSGINTLIVRVRDRDELFRNACQIAVEQGGFRAGWIGVVDPLTKKVVIAASVGANEDLMDFIRERVSLNQDALSESSPVALNIQKKQVVISNDLQNDINIINAEIYAKSGIRSLAVFPLLVSNESVGMLALYAGETELFHHEEVTLLEGLAGDISFAIDHIGKLAQLNYLAYYDELTGLANRRLFLERVAQYIRSATIGKHKLAVGLIDLERFKNINDSLGRPAGDALLKQVAEWLTRNAGGANQLARLDADHFAVVLPEVMQESDMARLLQKTMDAFMEHPFRIDDAILRISIKAGIALFPDDGADADTLFSHAEAALKKTKASGERYLFYTQKMTATVAAKLTLENQLRHALDHEEFVLHYQPKVNLLSGKVSSAEALIRWNKPGTGLVPPGNFIPILEETGLIFDVGRWALRQAIKDYLRWRAAGLAAVRIAVNVSPLQLRNRGFVAEIAQDIGTNANAAAGLELEITESLIMEDVKHNISSLQAIRAMGVNIAIDDFGTGFSSLSYLSKLPVDTLKIDRSFVIDMTNGPEGLALVSTIIQLAHALRLKVVAEGVETDEQSRLLRLLDCDEMQGYWFSKPVPSEIFETRFLAPASAG